MSDLNKRMAFREAETRFSLLNLNAGRSIALVGVGSVGKSNFLRHLLHADLRSAILGPEAEGLHLIYIDPNNMLDSLPPMNGTSNPTGWAGYEIMTHRLYRYFYPQFDRMPEYVGKNLLQVYQNLQDGKNPLTVQVGLRSLEYAIDLLAGQGLRLVFVFDEFEAMLNELPPRFFRTLRGLRDDYKRSLMYMTASRKALPDLVHEGHLDYDALEPFIELFSDTTRYISAYTMRDSLMVLADVAERLGVALPDRTQDQIYRLSGGHTALLKAAVELSNELQDTRDDDWNADRLARYGSIQAGAYTIFLSLNASEQQALEKLMRGETVSQDATLALAVNTLTQKQLLNRTSDGLQITPPLFRAYLRSRK
jgi:hypothetical protein